MKKIFITALVSVCSLLAFAQKKNIATAVPYTIAERYFLKNDVSIADPEDPKKEAIIVFDKEMLEYYFGYATVMGPNGKPTTIDFATQYALAIIPQKTDSSINLKVKSLTLKENTLSLVYEKYESVNKASFTSNSFLLLIFDKKYYRGKLQANAIIKKGIAQPTIKPLKKEGGLGQVTFSTNAGTVFFYDTKTKRGQINVDGKLYTLIQYKFINNNGTGKKNGYTLSGVGVSINAPNFTDKDNSSGADCIYGTIPVVTITVNGVKTTLKNVSVQDCPNY